MFTNEFGQTIKGDWVSVSLTSEELTALGTTVIRTIVRSSDAGVTIEGFESEEVVLHASLTGVTEESDAQKLRESLGIDIRIFAKDDEYNANDSYGFADRIINLIFGEETSYTFDNEGKIIIEISFDEYIRRTHGL